MHLCVAFFVFEFMPVGAVNLVDEEDCADGDEGVGEVEGGECVADKRDGKWESDRDEVDYTV